MAIETPAYGPMHMSSTRNYEVQRTNHFRLCLTIEGNKEIELAVDSVGLPSIETEAVELAYGNSSVKVAGRATYNEISVVVKDFIEADVEMILWKWRKMVYNPETDMIGWASKYKKDATIYQYGPDGTVLRKWKLIGCWPTGLDLGEMNYDGSEKKVITMTLAIDKAYPEREGTKKR